MFLAVSFGRPSSLKPMLTMTYNGSLPIALKKLNGARLTTPLSVMVVIQAIGRGTTKLVKSL
jgi:hypothetical protein